MKVKDLIAELEVNDPDMDVMVPGYEGGFHDSLSIHKRDIVRDVNKEWWYGPHDEEYIDTDKPKESVLVIGYRAR